MKFMQIEPQPARGVLKESMWTDSNWIAEEKYDGDRRIAQFCGNMARFTGRRISVKDGLYVEKTENVPHLSGSCTVSTEHARRTPRGLDGTVLDGEMIIPLDDIAGEYGGGKSKFVTSIMGSLPEEAVRKQIQNGWLRYVVFDCLFYKGQDVRDRAFSARRLLAAAAVGEWKNPYVSQSDWSAAKRSYYKEIISRGGEGIVLKHEAHRYGDKTGWVKVKKTATADVVIMGFVPAKEMSIKKGEDKATQTKYAKAGLIGAVIVGQYTPKAKTSNAVPSRVLEEVATISGMDDALRADITKYPKKYLGLVWEIEHNGREPTGRFRHPRYNRPRPDKRAVECVMREGEV